MQLIEVMVAVSVFLAASVGTLQLMADAAGSTQQTEWQRQQLERIELDRLHLHAYWRSQLLGMCAISPELLRATAARLPAPPQLQREVVVGAQVDELWLRWRLAGEAAPVRERLVTSAGLGISCAASAPLAESQQEHGT